jgi:trimeric autotransporter adhesin
MNLRRALYILLCLGAAILAGCNSGNGVGAMPINTTVRVVNLVPNAPPITFTIDSNAPLVTGLAFEQQTLYLDTTSGMHQFTVTDGGNSTLASLAVSLANGQAYTLVVYGPQEQASSNLLTDSPISITQDGGIVTIPNSGTFALRLSNFAEGVGAIDMYITSPGADLAFTAPTIIDVGSGQTTAFVPVNTGSYEVRFATNGTKNVIFDTGAMIAFGDQSILEAVAYGKGSSKLVGLDILNLNTQGGAQIYQNLLAQFKLVNASAVGPPLNVLVDGVLTLTNIPFAGVSTYVKTLAQAQTISIESTATPGASLLTFTADFAPATDSSIVVSGPAGALQDLVLTDNNMPSATGRARVRFVNASPDLASLDVYVNFVPTFAHVLSNSASGYTELVANITGSTFNIGFNIAGTTTPALTLPSVTFVAGTTYTVYVVGPGSSPQGVVVSDN